jgi:hypothetical protein
MVFWIKIDLSRVKTIISRRIFFIFSLENAFYTEGVYISNNNDVGFYTLFFYLKNSHTLFFSLCVFDKSLYKVCIIWGCI